MWCQHKMSSNKSNNSPLVWQMGLWSMKTSSSHPETQCKLTVWEKEHQSHRTAQLHLQYWMQPYKAGHHQCAKAISLVLVDMIQMKKGEPENWTKLAKTHVIRHSYSHLSGIAAVLSGSRCSLRSIIGLSHRRKWGEAQQFSWLLSKSTSAEYT